MNISSLSIRDKRKLGELLEDLVDILNRKDSLIETADKEIDRMSVIDDMQTKLDVKSSEFTSIATPIDAKELQGLVEKSDRLSSEKEEINLKSKQIYDDIVELEDIEKSLMEEINNILFSSDKEKEEEKGIFIDSMNTNVCIIDKQIPENKDVVNDYKCEIINCNVDLIIEIAKLYRSNISKIVLAEEEYGFDELKEKVEKYKIDKNSSYDKQLELLRSSFNVENTEVQEEKENEAVVEEKVAETTQNVESEKPILEPVKEDNIVVNSNNEVKQEEVQVEQPVVQEEKITEEPKEIIEPTVTLETINRENPIIQGPESDNQNVESVVSLEPINNNQPKQEESITPLTSLLDQQLMMPAEEPITEQNNQDNLINFKYTSINTDDKVIPNKLVAATKEKLNNKILDICWGSFQPRKFQYFSPLGDNLGKFNLNEFVNSNAA